MAFFARLLTRSGSAETRRRAAGKLGASGGTRAIEALSAMLADEEWTVRVAALEALGLTGRAETVEPILEAVRASGASRERAATDLRRAAVASLQRLGPAAVPVLARAVGDRNTHVREAAVEALGGIGTPETVPALSAALRDDRSAVRQPAARGLGGVGSPEAADALLSAASHRDPATRRAVVEALGASGEARSIAALTAALNDGDRQVREAAARGLGRLGSRPAIEPLLAAFQGGDRDLRALASDALRDARWQPANARERAAAAVLRNDYASAAAEGEAAVDLLVAALDAREPALRRAAAESLGLTGDARAARAVAGAMTDRDESVRAAAGRALELMGAAAAAPVIDLLDGGADHVRTAAAAVLGRIGESRVADYLASALSGSGVARDDSAGLLMVTEAAALERARSALESLATLLRHLASRLGPRELTTLASLGDVVRLLGPPVLGRDPADTIDERVGSEEVRRLAAHELKRRGLEVPPDHPQVRRNE